MFNLLAYLRQNKVLYSVVAFQAVILVLTAFGFLPRIAVLYLTALAMIYMAVLRPIDAVRFFILSLPWTVALPLGDYDKLQNWRLLIAEVFVITVIHKWPEFVKALRGGLGALFKFFRLSKVDYSFLALMVVNVLVLFVNPGFLLPGVKQVITYLNLYLIFVVVRLIVDTDQERKQVLMSAAGATLAIVLAGWAQQIFFSSVHYIFFWQSWANTFLPVIYGNEYALVSVDANTWFSYQIGREPALRMFSLMPGSQVFAMISLFAAAFLLTWRGWVDSIKTRRWLMVAVVAALSAAVFTSVRATVVGLLVPLVLLMFLHFRKKISDQSFKRGLVPLGIFVIILIISPLVQMVINGSGSALERVGSTTGLGYQSNAARLIIWKESLNSVKEHPLFGVGVGNFALVFEDGAEGRSFEEIVQTKEEFVNMARKTISAHNIFLQVLVESGLVGLIFFIVFVFMVLKNILRALGGQSTSRSMLALYFGVALVWILGHGMFDSVFLTDDEPLTFFWIGLALLGTRDL